MADRFSRRLLEQLQHDNYEPVPLDRLAGELGITADERAEFDATIRSLQSAGRLVIGTDGKIGLPAIGEEIVGVFRKNMRGFGFVIPDQPVREGDLFIPPDATGDALTGDRVRAAVQRRRDGDRMSGRIVEVLVRTRTRFTGELAKQGTTWIVHPDGRLITAPIVVRDAEAKNGRPGVKVVVEVTSFPEGNTLAEGVIVEVLGEAGLPSVETQATIAAYNLPGEFPESCNRQARDAGEAFAREVAEGTRSGFRLREDLRERFIITIDPPDARDYDDAIHIARTGTTWELGVHIADVAHFIPAGSPLDVEARERGNSVYLPRHVIPMLPEVLSNGICSLQEGVERFCASAFMAYDAAGEILRQGVARTVIRSRKRLTYLEAQALIDGDETEARKHARTEPNYTPELVGTLREMDTLARRIRERRRRAGMIHLELPDVVLLFDDEGRVIDAEREDDAFTHTIIEMFMVEANEVLARLFERLRVPLLRRIHPEPTPGDVDDLRQVSRVAGHAIPKHPTRQELQTLLDATRGTPAAPAVHFAVLRTLTRAEYSPALIGHYALASEAYAHFTSPIRRYPDLTVHRALAAYLQRTANGSRPPKTTEEQHALGRALLESGECPSEDELVTVGRHCTRTEENAAAAEEDLRQFLVLQLLSNHVGETFRGMVTGVTNAGVFVQLEKYLASGMVKSADLPVGPGGRVGAWRIDQRSGALVNQASGRSFAIGHQVGVRIAAIDLAMRRMDLVIADESSREKGKAAKVGASGLGGGLGGSGALVDWEAIKGGGGAARRSQRSKQRERGKSDFRKERKDKGKK